MKHQLIACLVSAGLILTGCNDTSQSSADDESKSVTQDIEALVGRLTALEEENERLVLQVAEMQVSLDDANSQSTQLDTRVEQVEELLTCVDFDSANLNLIVESCNLIVRDGSGSTASTTGLGNLIIGYDADESLSKDKSGTHNLIVGDEHEYSSYGGLVAGRANSVHGPYASVTGGRNNIAGLDYASVSGGNGVTASVVDAWAASDISSDGTEVVIDTDFIEIGASQSMDIDGGVTLSLGAVANVEVSAGVGLDISAGATTKIGGSLIQIGSGGMPAARLGDLVSIGGGTGNIIQGSATVLIGN